MKRNLLFAMILMAFVSLPSMAEMTVEQSTDAEYVINSGYSQAVAEDVFMMKNRATGQPIEPLYDKKQGFWRKIHAYLDPAIENYDRLHHDINHSPTILDL